MDNRKWKLMLLGVSLAVVSSIGSTARGQELVVNRTFDQGIAGWVSSNGYGTLDWSSTQGRPPGSLRLSGVFPEAAPGCLPVVHGGIKLSADVFAQTPMDTGLCALNYAWFRTSDCTGSFLTIAEIDEPIIPTTLDHLNEWVHLEFELPHPDGYRSFYGIVFKRSDLNDDDVCFFDNVSLIQTPVAPVPVLDARGLVALVVLLGLAGVFVVRRRG